jgi:molecular chaperone GrpE
MSDDPSQERAPDASPVAETTEEFSPDDILGVVEEVDTVPDDDQPVGGDIDPADVDVVALLDERNQFLDAYRRSQADFENFRKQAHKRQGDEVARVLGRFVEGLLPVLDAGDAAMAHDADGATEVFTALLGALEKEGLQRVDPIGEPFDPNVAEAVMHEPGDGGEQVVAEVLRIGYLWNDRVLRPAMVKVKD